MTELKKATFGAGCFWCVEAVFARLKGVTEVLPGYTGGDTDNPTYKEVCQGTTNHAEVLQLAYDPDAISYAQLLEVFFKTHDPTTKDRQGADVGTQYRSSIFWHDEEQQRLAAEVIDQLNKAEAFAEPIVTEVSRLGKFWPAEDYHRDYFAQNPEAQFCQMVIRPKVEKFEKAFSNLLK